VTSTLKLLEYARRAGVKTFVLASTGGVYTPQQSVLHETDTVGISTLNGFYPASKAMAEIVANQYRSFFNVIILRFFFVYGPGQNSTMLIPRLVDSVKNQKPVSLSGNDGIQINPIYVDDAVRAIKKCFDLGESGTFNIAGEEVLTMRQIAEQIAAALNTTANFNVQPGSEGQNLIASIDKMKARLGDPQVSFATGIKHYLESLHESTTKP
jgi:nucleoside-diphosphate-sugar epimerase